ncbi:MFS transporter [Amnibacterium kyonggiense]|uniref:MFS transporter n=1 Tax=Amnibacterium kyonggiense TaxID=595671 RepID=UPI0013C300BE|nr:MFS transporter [Amnibacterium kyonggiense]
MARLTVAVLCLVQFVDVLGVTSATTAIPTIVRALDADGSAAALIGSAYATAFGGLLVVGARIGDRVGARRLVLAGVAAFGAIGGAAAFATDVRLVVLARALQGAAAAVTVPSALRLLLAVAERDPFRRRAVGLWSAAGAVAGACGFLVGGLLTQAAGWQAVFWIAGPVAVVLLVALIPLTAPLPRPVDRSQRIGPLGALLLVTAVACVVLGASLAERAEGRSLGGLLVLGGLVVAAALVAQQRRTTAPLLPSGGFRDRNLRTGAATAFVNTATTSAVAVLATIQLQTALSAPPLVAGLALLPISVGAVLGSLAAPRIGATLAPRRAAALGLAGIAAGDAGLAAAAASLPGTVVAGSVMGLGLGAASVPATAIGTDVPAGLVGGAAGVVNTAAQLGTALGVAGLVVLAGVVGGAAGTTVADLVAAAIALVMAIGLASVRGPARPRS